MDGEHGTGRYAAAMKKGIADPNGMAECRSSRSSGRGDDAAAGPDDLERAARAKAEDAVRSARGPLEARTEAWAVRVLDAFREARVQTADFAPSTGYGYDAPGRDKLDRIWSRLCKSERAVVRPQLASGSAALSHALFAVARPGQEVVLATGTPYDTLLPVLGPGPGSLAAWGVASRMVAWDGHSSLLPARDVMRETTCAVMLQRSRGYARRRALGLAEIARLTDDIHRLRPDVAVLVDNSYAEFTESDEPPAVGVDLIAGSWTKNPGGGLAPTGGYLAGRADLVENALTRITVPGQGGEVGAWPLGLRLYYQGLFLAPGAVREALLGGVYARHLFHELGFRVDPGPEEQAGGDVVTRIEMGSEPVLLAAVRAIQAFSPVDSMARPEGDAMPGYADPVVMAAGTFVQGAGLELTADAPVRPPYDLFVQGGLSLGATKRALAEAAHAALLARETPPCAAGP